jgi:hypothetical protein
MSTTKTRKSSQDNEAGWVEPSPLLDEGTLYLAFDRYVCGRLNCCGATALYTRQTIGGAPVLDVTPEEVAAFSTLHDGAPLVCECGKVSAIFEPLRPLAEIEADAERAGLMKKKRAPRTRKPAPTGAALVDALNAIEERSAVLRAQEEQKPENVAQKSTQRGQTCQWVACDKRATSVRSLAGQKWSVCSEHNGSAL